MPEPDDLLDVPSEAARAPLAGARNRCPAIPLSRLQQAASSRLMVDVLRPLPDRTEPRQEGRGRVATKAAAPGTLTEVLQLLETEMSKGEGGRGQSARPPTG
jgi:hypothetical protein